MRGDRRREVARENDALDKVLEVLVAVRERSGGVLFEAPERSLVWRTPEVAGWIQATGSEVANLRLARGGGRGGKVSGGGSRGVRN